MSHYFGKKRESDGHTHGWTVFLRPFKNEVRTSAKFLASGSEKAVDYISNRTMEVLKIKLHLKKNNRSIQNVVVFIGHVQLCKESPLQTS